MLETWLEEPIRLLEEELSKPGHIYKTEIFAKIVNDFQSFIIFAKSSI